MEDEKYIGYIKYSGSLVEEGLMDGRKQAQALLSFDASIRYFIEKQAPDFRNLDFEIPVRIKKGSWEALIPETAIGWAQAGLGTVALAYFSKAAQKMAEKDFADFGIKDLFKNALDGMKWFARIGKHMGDLAIRSFENAKFMDNNSLIGIQNSQGEYLYVPKGILDMYVTCSPRLLEKLAEFIEDGRDLRIGTFDSETPDEVVIQVAEKSIFYTIDQEVEEDVLFPELVHGETAILEGEVTRENKTSNSLGFKYKDHILTAYPDSGNIVPFKPMLFLKCRMFAIVNRIDEKGRIAAAKPKLYFSHLEPLEDDNENGLI